MKKDIANRIALYGSQFAILTSLCIVWFGISNYENNTSTFYIGIVGLFISFILDVHFINNTYKNVCR